MVDAISHNVSSFLKHGGAIRREGAKNALKFQFTVTIHKVQLNDSAKIKHAEWEWVVVWSRGAKIAATHYARGRPLASGTEMIWQQELSLLGTAFMDKAGGFMEKSCKFVLKQMKSDNKTHVSVGRVKLNLAEHISMEDRETVLELRLRDKKNNPIGTMSITLACRFLRNYNRETGTCVSGMSETSIDSGLRTAESSDDEAVKRNESLSAITVGVGASRSSGASLGLDRKSSAASLGVDRKSSTPSRGSSLSSPPSALAASVSAAGVSAAAGPSQQIDSMQAEIDELRRIVDEQHFENERLRDQVESLTEQLEKRRDQTERLARSMTTYEVELLRTSEKQARIEAEVEERLTSAFVPVIQKLEAELRELQGKRETDTAAAAEKGKSRWGRK